MPRLGEKHRTFFSSFISTLIYLILFDAFASFFHVLILSFIKHCLVLKTSLILMFGRFILTGCYDGLGRYNKTFTLALMIFLCIPIIIMGYSFNLSPGCGKLLEYVHIYWKDTLVQFLLLVWSIKKVQYGLKPNRILSYCL